jgi:hypothetical protein
MSMLDRLSSLLDVLRPNDGRYKVYVFGDSHTDALKRALNFEGRSDVYPAIKLLRIRKQKGSSEIGDVDFPTFCKKVKHLTRDEIVVSCIGGNQYAIVSTIKLEGDTQLVTTTAHLGDDLMLDLCQNIIPFRVLKSFIESGVRSSDAPMLQALRASTKARVVHLIPPPPKFDNDFICNAHETRFKNEGLNAQSVSEPQFRLECWKMQRDCLIELGKEIGVEMISPPARAVTEDGYLQPLYYGNDVTHANRRYGELVLKQINALMNAGTDRGLQT